MEKTRIELLSPAKDCEVGIAAISHGADAVYIGGPSFGAREKAGNSIADIERICRYAAQYDARVYVTLNTLLFDNELEQARTIAYDCWNAGVDALIVQDVALLQMDMPPIALHASTQCHNMTAEKVLFLEKVGFSQVVLARELSLQQIKEIRSKTTVPLEFFVHGSLCVCHSGQCYLSHYIGNRSANRGACAQPCRLPWNLIDEEGRVLIKDKHLLSLKDLNNSAHIEQLIDAGVTSFKIEGRLKDADYVKNITAYYRNVIDKVMERRSDLQSASRGRCLFNFVPNPEKTFSRGSTDYFFNGRVKDIGSPDTPKSMGEYVGRVTWCNSSQMELDTDKTLHNGDGLCFIDEKGQLQGLRADVVNGKKVVCHTAFHGASRGVKVYRNYDIEWQKQLSASTGNRLIDINLQLSETADGYSYKATLADEDVCAEISISCDKIEANNPEKALDNINRKAMQWGDTMFRPINLTLDFAVPRLIPASVLGEMKRQLVQKLMEVLIYRHLSNREKRITVSNTEPYFATELSYLGNVANEKAAEFYRLHGVETIDDALEKSRLKQPDTKVMTCSHCVRFANGMCSKETGQCATPLYIKNGENTFRLEFDCRNCVMNVYSI